MTYYSPLRYPGGKTKIANDIKGMMKKSGKKIYAEPFCGGAGVALEMLMSGAAEKIILNDSDYGIYCFWISILHQTDSFIKLIENTPVTVSEWEKQRYIYMNANRFNIFETGFAAFYLNRTNRSGILKAGIIGGKKQDGKYKIDARFGKNGLIKKIIKIAERKNDIIVMGLDFEDFIMMFGSETFLYCDPPYYQKGKQLYTNYFSENDHIRLKESLKYASDFAVTYDNDPFIKKLYENYDSKPFSLRYSAGKSREGDELMIVSNKKYLIKD